MSISLPLGIYGAVPSWTTSVDQSAKQPDVRRVCGGADFSHCRLQGTAGRLEGICRVRSLRADWDPVDLSPSTPLYKEQIRSESPGGVTQRQL